MEAILQLNTAYCQQLKPVQHIARSNLKFADYPSTNPVRGATSEETYHEEYVINILTEQAELKLKYGPLIAEQSKRTENKTKLRENRTKTKNHNREEPITNE